jgi:hypothetical protein
LDYAVRLTQSRPQTARREQEMEWMDVVKVYGPLGVFMPLFIYLLKFILTNYKSDIESRLKLAEALNQLT